MAKLFSNVKANDFAIFVTENAAMKYEPHCIKLYIHALGQCQQEKELHVMLNPVTNI